MAASLNGVGASWPTSPHETFSPFPCTHHCGHNEDRLRGHSSLLGAADVEISVKRDASDNIVATVDRSKNGATGTRQDREPPCRGRVGARRRRRRDGDVVEPVGEPAATKASAKPKATLTKTAKNALRALHMAIGELGEVPPTSSHIPFGVKAVKIEQ